jgi:hypothetical protein
MLNMERAMATMDALCHIKGFECPALSTQHFTSSRCARPSSRRSSPGS